MSDVALAAAAALPWIIAPLVVAIRARNSRTLDEMPATPPPDAPLVSVIIPARNEARCIAQCVRSVLSTTYPSVEVVVVDDHSTDGTGDLAHAAASGDQRLRVMVPPPLPDGWFGKQWACASGAGVSRGEMLCFADADTVHAPDLLVRSVHAMRDRGADLFSVAGRQELGGFWERVIQPQVFALLSARYGGSEQMERSPRVVDKIANGQCLFVRREAYESLGGHALVKDKVAEDLALAQRFFGAGRRVGLAVGVDQLSTRMYTSLGELVRGWGKNVYAGGREAMHGGRFGRAIFPFVLPVGPLFMLVPLAVLLAGLAGLASETLTIWAAITTAAITVWWAIVYIAIRESPLHALAWPLGAGVLLWIMLGAIARGERVTWKGRAYTSR